MWYHYEFIVRYSDKISNQMIFCFFLFLEITSVPTVSEPTAKIYLKLFRTMGVHSHSPDHRMNTTRVSTTEGHFQLNNKTL